MEQENNIGKWSAKFDDRGIIPYIMVTGIFQTNGEKVLHYLLRNDPQGTTERELLLTLIFGEFVDPAGQEERQVVYSEYATRDRYETVLIVDPNGRRIASVHVGVPTPQEKELTEAQ